MGYEGVWSYINRFLSYNKWVCTKQEVNWREPRNLKVVRLLGESNCNYMAGDVEVFLG